MKIILQSEAKTISNQKLTRNQKDLMNLINKVTHLKLGFFNKATEKKSLS